MTKSSTSNLVNVRGTELLASDTRERYRQKIARITLNSTVQFVGLLDAKGTVVHPDDDGVDGLEPDATKYARQAAGGSGVTHRTG
jgi:hypothetical protein